MLLLLAGAHYLTAVNATVLFWPAFALTRPLGAAGGDAITKPVGAGGLGWGAAWGAAALALVLVASVAFQTRRFCAAALPRCCPLRWTGARPAPAAQRRTCGRGDRRGMTQEPDKPAWRGSRSQCSEFG